jgi:TonB family protein
MKIALVLSLSMLALPAARAAAQPPRDTRPPAVENARRERELRALVAAGTATKETYLELAGLAQRQGRFADTIEALRGAAALEPDEAEPQHRIATYYWEHAAKEASLDPAARLTSIKEGLAAEERALALRPDYADAMVYKNILLRMQANLTGDPVEKARLIAEADALRSRVLQMQQQKASGPPPPVAPEAPTFTGFDEPYEQTVARVQPVRIGGSLRAPTKIRDVKPDYPAEARAARVQGVVIIEAVIDETGAVANAHVLRSIPMLDDSALAAVSRWRFTPTEANGRAIGVIMTVTVNFSMQ